MPLSKISLSDQVRSALTSVCMVTGGKGSKGFRLGRYGKILSDRIFNFIQLPKDMQPLLMHCDAEINRTVNCSSEKLNFTN